MRAEIDRTTVELDLAHQAQVSPEATALRIGVLGAGWIVRECHLPAYRKAGFQVVALASRSAATATEVAGQFDIDRVHTDWHQLLEEDTVDILDIAVPPDVQPEIIREAIKHVGHLKGILAQKPLAMDARAAADTARLCRDAGVVLSVNQNMRYDQSIRALKTLLTRGYLGEIWSAQITMHARVHWMPYAEHYARRALLIMSIHHLDTFRFLFGDPDRIIASVRRDPLVQEEHVDGYAAYVLEYGSGLRAIAIDNCLTERDQGIEWRVEGSSGVAKGTVGWMFYPDGAPSTIDFSLGRAPGYWFSPRWPERWFPDAFIGTMGQLLEAITRGVEPEITGLDHVRTMALVDAAYQSAKDGCAVDVGEAFNALGILAC